MRLVTYDRGGHRRLGAILEGEVIDLPDAVGHPVFPVTLEDLVSSSRGTILDAARAALQREDVWQWRVRRARVLAPLFPASLVSPLASDAERSLAGPEDDIAWPDQVAGVQHDPMIVAVLGNETSKTDPGAVRRDLFGYTLVNDWRALSESGTPADGGHALPIAIGPCVVTADELDPRGMLVRVRIDGQDVREASLNGAADRLLSMIAEASERGSLERGDAFAIGTFPATDPGCPDDPAARLWPGAVVELGAEGIGTLRNRLVPAPSA
jgi:2-keto-4-pentenoate hydratase/2-oxohepta-3-ene-1,7-dioic acid hydratase in catechol pathway